MDKKSAIAIIFVLIISALGIYFYKQAKDSASQLPEMNMSVSEVTILDPYAFATTPSAKTAAAFLKITNPNDTSDKLVEVWSPIAKINEIHENLIDPDDGTMMMRKIKALDLPAKSSVILEPKGYHIMFIQMKQQLNQGESFPLTLVFENSGEQIVDVAITAPGENPHANHKH